MQEYQIDYKWEEEPLLVLPLCVGGMLLSGKLFGWLRSLDPGSMTDDSIAGLKILYFGFLFCCAALAAWRLLRTIHATDRGVEYRFLGRTQKIIPWDDFSCATLGRARQMRTKQVFPIPNICAELPADPAGKHRFLTQHYQKLIHFHGTGNNIRAIGTYLKGL